MKTNIRKRERIAGFLLRLNMVASNLIDSATPEQVKEISDLLKVPENRVPNLIEVNSNPTLYTFLSLLEILSDNYKLIIEKGENVIAIQPNKIEEIKGSERND